MAKPKYPLSAPSPELELQERQEEGTPITHIMSTCGSRTSARSRTDGQGQIDRRARHRTLSGDQVYRARRGSDHASGVARRDWRQRMDSASEIADATSRREAIRVAWQLHRLSNQLDTAREELAYLEAKRAGLESVYESASGESGDGQLMLPGIPRQGGRS